MARSMTAYGRAYAETDAGLFLIEIQSVNRRNLDLNLTLPKELLMLDIPLRQRLSEEVRRGHVSLRITRGDKKSAQLALPDRKVLRELHASWKECASDLGYNPDEAIPFNALLSYALTATPSETLISDAFKEQLDRGYKEALGYFLEMKESEGRALMEDIRPRLDSIEKRLIEVEKLSKNAPDRYQEKLTKRLKKLKIDCVEDEDRLMREVVIFVDRIDVTEEITRLRSHVKQFRDQIDSEKRRVGKELDFLIQEMNREANTIAAKSQELEITQAILSVKSEQEKIREQLQNIE
ncbi:MAG: hypothetical protein K1060chlam2_00387 [Chlamydiae bacterium]|nr:hypothetical protein [Chlamydiota bacterium]